MSTHGSQAQTHGRNQKTFRFIPGVVGIAALWAALWAALLRLGWSMGGMGSSFIADHGALMVGGFLGTVIGLERAVAAGRSWTYAAPGLSALGAVFLLSPFPAWSSQVAITLASLVLVAVFVHFLRTQWSDFTLTMAVGALCWAVGNAMWLLQLPLRQVVPWWAAFLILTIAGERLEMSRLRPRSPQAQRRFWAWTALYAVGLVATFFAFDIGVRLSGVALLGLTGWLVRHDIARVTIRGQGMPRYAATAMLLGYVWLAVAGVLALLWGSGMQGFLYDALLHAQFLGFVFGMIMAHAPIIIPAVAGVSLAFSPLFYVPLLVLHASLVLRIGADLAGWWPGFVWGGTFNVAAVILFLIVVVQSVVRGALERAQVKGKLPR